MEWIKYKYTYNALLMEYILSVYPLEAYITANARMNPMLIKSDQRRQRLPHATADYECVQLSDRQWFCKLRNSLRQSVMVGKQQSPLLVGVSDGFVRDSSLFHYSKETWTCPLPFVYSVTLCHSLSPWLTDKYPQTWSDGDYFKQLVTWP